MKQRADPIVIREKPGAYSDEAEKAPRIISIHEAKSSLSKLVKRAAAGETIYIGAYGKPEAAITPINSGKYRAEQRAKAFGCMRGKMELPEGWDEPLPDDVIESFYSTRGLEDFEKK